MSGGVRQADQRRVGRKMMRMMWRRMRRRWVVMAVVVGKLSAAFWLAGIGSARPARVRAGHRLNQSVSQVVVV